MLKRKLLHRRSQSWMWRNRSMMLSFKWISKTLFTILMLQLTATAGQQRAFFTVKTGDGVTLPCGNVGQEKHNCDRITWTFSRPGNRNVSLFERSRFTEEANAKSGRLSVAADCSLVIKSVTVEDSGQYGCRQNNLIMVDLSVVTMTEQRNNGKVTFTCSVSQLTYCRHSVMWLYEGKEEISPDMNVSSCSAAVTIPASHLHHNSKFYQLLKCKVQDGYNAKKELLFTFSRQSSGDKTEQSTTTPATTSATTKSILTQSERTESALSTSSRWLTSETPTAALFTKNNQTKSQGWIWWAVMVSMLLAGLLITVIVIIGWIKTKGNKKQKEDQPVDFYASYASINHGNETRTNRNVPDTVIYSTLQAPSAVI
ncbi:uncharacterized protein LOC129356474 isoform X2 [Poeciliopsis prolifica]|uniref:uncharacterized protein LOC129356474 isoform X2 n=1 Tax=Poeciliopsis prolifica TaxID=188132 RepID=UPI0024143EEB|nr:uncharacterized protein LOC129356474 isoform X2 [Poeciliopsis prolifica]